MTEGLTPMAKSATSRAENTAATPAIANVTELGKVPAFAHFIAENEHGRYCVPEAFAAREVPQLLAQGKVYEPRTIRQLRHFMGSGDIVTGGAFVGDFLPALAEALHPNAQIHSFEPAPITHAAAAHTVRLNGLSDVILHNVAVGDAPGVLPLQIARGAGGPQLAAAAKIVPGESGDHVVKVPVVRLDDLIPEERRITVLHLDIEGFELRALMGAKRLIAQNAPVIVLEAAKRRQQLLYKRALRQHFPDLRYHITEVIENNAIFIPFRMG